MSRAIYNSVGKCKIILIYFLALMLALGWNVPVVLADSTTTNTSTNTSASGSQSASNNQVSNTNTGSNAGNNTSSSGTSSQTSSSAGNGSSDSTASSTGSTATTNTKLSSVVPSDLSSNSTNQSTTGQSATDNNQTHSSTATDTSANSNSSSNSANQTGPTSPTGPAANTFIYNPSTGMWQNQYYIWNPSTGQTTPITPQNYSYNPSTGMWDTTQWIYDPASGHYVPNTVSVTSPPAPTGASDPSITLNNNNNTTFDGFYNAAISNNINSYAASGNASVINDTLGGNAASGNASTVANVINVLQSTTPMTEGNVDTFTTNLYGNIQGNLLINPSVLLSNINGNTSVNQNTNNNLTINTSSNNLINNNIVLAAQSGDASVTGNTTGGNATSGNAESVANVLNMINSMIGAQNSFVGTINVYGNLNGNIEVPSQLLSQLIGSNGPNSTTTVNSGATTNINANLTNNTAINNSINALAQSGNASVTNNTTGGNATSGNSSTNVTILNLTGDQVVGADTLLVFINVSGKWIGLMMNAPAGSTSAAYGSNLTENNTVNTNANLTDQTNNTINNNINVSAKSGNASVTNNTTGGNATTGNAYSAVNLGNMVNDQFSLTNWFGILFINIFGNWLGDFSPLTQSTAPGTISSNNGNVSNQSQSMPGNEGNISASAVFGFTPTSVTSSGNTASTTNTLAGVYTVKDPSSGLVSQVEKLDPALAAIAPKTSNNRSSFNYLVAALLFLGVALLIVERIISKRTAASKK
jgi:hypothetical protein